VKTLSKTYMAVFLALLLCAFQPAFAKSNTKLIKKVEKTIGLYYPQDFDISVSKNGIVKIKGEVHTLYDRYRVYDIVSKVPGVREIEDDLNITVPMLPDKEIEDNIIEQFKIVRSILEPEKITVHVDNGVVFLNGEVSFQREKIAAETAASWQKGVKGIVNNLKVLPAKVALSDENLHAVLRDVLKDQFPLEKGVRITVKNGVVTLTGKVRVLWVQRKVEQEFSRIIGVKNVVNHLTVEPPED